jgi:hypothetical protein
VLDAAGEKVFINVFEGRSRREVDTLKLTAGRTPVFVVPDTAATVVLKKGGAEVRRAPISLQGGDVNHVQL